jgi:hypothetical protein
MGCCASKENLPVIPLHMAVYIPSWDLTGNIGGIRRFTSIFGISLYIGEKGNRGDKDRPPNGRITSRETKDINRYCMGLGTHNVVTNSSELLPLIENDTIFIMMETPDYWEERKITPTSLYDISPSGNLMFIFGNERDGIDNEVLANFINYVPCYLPQEETLVNTRARHNNVSLNLAHAVIATVSIMKGKAV